MIQDFAPEEQAPEDYSFAETKPLITLSESVASCFYPHIACCLKELGIRVLQVIFADSRGDIRTYLESGTGFPVLPSTLVSFFSPSTRFIPVLSRELKYGALWDPDSEADAST